MPEPSFTSTRFAKATRFRSNAAACGSFAANAVSPMDRALLLRMQRVWLDRASHQDTIDELPPRPPAGAGALAAPRR